VSRVAGVSVATVSKALNGATGVSDDARSRVLEAAERLDYRPSRSAQALAGRRTHLIGYCLPEPGRWGNPTLDAFLHAMVASSALHNLEVVVFSAHATDGLTPYRDLIRRGAVDGFLLSETDYHDRRIEYLAELGFPFASFGRTDDTDGYSWVDVDGGVGCAAAVEHLASQGHRTLAMLAWPQPSEVGDARVAGFLEAVKRHDLNEPVVVRSPNGIEQGRQAYGRVMSENRDVTAIVAVQDELALGAILEARARNVTVGADLAVVGFDDIPSASIVDPPLTSLRQPFHLIGGILVDMLVDQIAGITAPRGELLAPELVIRDSSRRSRT
jgi:DNA-binding LacI/PurR family transcriptional regulator